MSRYARATDANHGTILRGLHRLGIWARDTHEVGDGFPDIIAHGRSGFVLLEVKDPAQPPSRRRLTDAEEAFHGSCPGPVAVIHTIQEAVEELGFKLKI